MGRKTLGPRGPHSNLASFKHQLAMRPMWSKQGKQGSKSKLSNIRRFADLNRRHETPAEKRLHAILLALNNGKLKGRFSRQHPISGKWIVDFFFPEVRLAVEVDGAIHEQLDQHRRDRLKEADCERFDITLIRVTNSQVFSDPDRVVALLRHGWRAAKDRKNLIIGKAYEDATWR